VSIQALLHTMEMLKEVHGSLLALAKQKTKVLVHNQVEELNLIIRKENQHIKQIAELDQQRVLEISKYLISRGYNPNPNITITDLARVVFKPGERRMLIAEQQNLLAVLTELRDVNTLNEQLIEQSLLFINYSLDLIAGSPDDDAFYHHPNNAAQLSKQTRYFDTRA
jgi:flagellar biosynthesis/type III secretory pathway chaperone